MPSASDSESVESPLAIFLEFAKHQMLEVPLSSSGAPLKQPNHYDHKRENEKNMNKSAHCERSKKAESPQKTQYNRKCK